MVTNTKAAKTRLISLRETLHRTGLSRTKLYLLKSRGVFPKSVTHPGCSKIFFREAEVDTYIEGLH